MKLTREDIVHLSNLSALEFQGEELDKFQEQFNDILSFVDQIENAKTEDEIVYEAKEFDELREDVCTSCLSQEEVIKNAPSSKFGCFAVPLMME